MLIKKTIFTAYLNINLVGENRGNLAIVKARKVLHPEIKDNKSTGTAI